MIACSQARIVRKEFPLLRDRLEPTFCAAVGDHNAPPGTDPPIIDHLCHSPRGLMRQNEIHNGIH